ncbi:hypothetical protein C4564_03765 [Candidatus Microgenomates bacterium]|nr:MAG: hypothetical protein C4564_03765 [Candidatus Microgenomates bacterium]
MNRISFALGESRVILSATGEFGALLEGSLSAMSLLSHFAIIFNAAMRHAYASLYGVLYPNGNDALAEAIAEGYRNVAGIEMISLIHLIADQVIVSEDGTTVNLVFNIGDSHVEILATGPICNQLRDKTTPIKVIAVLAAYHELGNLHLQSRQRGDTAWYANKLCTQLERALQMSWEDTYGLVTAPVLR